MQTRPRAAFRQPLDERRPAALRHRDLDGQRRRCGRSGRSTRSPGGTRRTFARRRTSTSVREMRARSSSLVNVVMPGELGRPDVWRLRLIGPGGRLHDTHYVHTVEVALAGRTYPVELEFATISRRRRRCLPRRHQLGVGAHSRTARPSDPRTRRPARACFAAVTSLPGRLWRRTRSAMFSSTVESASLGNTEELDCAVRGCPVGRMGRPPAREPGDGGRVVACGLQRRPDARVGRGA